ncbi:MAG: DEAD/DEAH box helicase [Chloroflexi bacterium]|nr:DEAD/DEAH box helicase [Chloroflexota bacterium]
MPFHPQTSLRHTWPVFFARHGSLTRTQQEAIPPILAGHNTLVVAATASGKTEAVLAPLLERHILTAARQGRNDPALRLLYICPTRALVRDLYERLQPFLAALHISVVMKSGDTGPVPVRRPPTVLITTPESTDSLLTRAPRLLGTLDAVVLDEIHLFDDSPRGDHIRCLLPRIEHIRRYRQQELGLPPRSWQRVALSATVPDPVGVAERYLRGPEEDGGYEIIEVPGGRALQAELRQMVGLDDLVWGLASRMKEASTIRKTLLFCNTRNEVEQTAAYLRQHLPFAAEVFVHYSNLNPATRRAVEDGFAEASVAICVATSTLELGIDIGSIDDVVLVGPPPSQTSFLQRIGRGGRRRAATQVLCLFRSPLEEIRFRALLDLAQTSPFSPAHSPFPLVHYHFRPSVLVQQIFSILKQSPTGAIRLSDLRRVTPSDIPDDTLRHILDHLHRNDFLRPGRLGEWRPASALDELFDAHEIYCNIGADPLAVTVVDAYSGRPIAQTDRLRVQGDTLLMGGRTMEVLWRDRYRIGVRPRDPGMVDETLRFRTKPLAIPLAMGQAVAAHLGLHPGEMCQVHTGDGALLFHFWGELYGALLAGLWQSYLGEDAIVTRGNEHCLYLPRPASALPPWNAAALRRQLVILESRIEKMLELGRFHSFLPPDLAHDTLIEHCDLPLFAQLYRAAEISTPAAGLRAQLLALV